MAPREPTPSEDNDSSDYSTVLACVAFLAVGIGAASAVVPRLLRDLKAESTWTETTCTIESGQIATSVDSEKGATYRPEFVFSHQREGRTYRAHGYDQWGTWSSDTFRARAIVERFEAGKQYPCWFDEAAPKEAVLARSGGWQRVWVFFPLPFILIGGMTLVEWIRERSAPIKLPAAPWLPTFRLARGVTRAVTLLPHHTERERLEATVFLMALYNSLASVGGGLLWDDYLESGSPKVVAIAPLALLGVGLIALTLYQFLIFIRVPESQLELSHAPLCPGDAFELSFVQGGRFHLEELRIQLLCEEKAVYREEKDTRREYAVVLDELLVHRRDVELRRGSPLAIEHIRAAVPWGAMHTFQSLHNQVQWKLVVKGAIAFWPDFEREYVLPVLPRELDAKFRERLVWEERLRE